MRTYECVKTDKEFDLQWAMAVVVELKWEGKADKYDCMNLTSSLLDEEFGGEE